MKLRELKVENKIGKLSDSPALSKYEQTRSVAQNSELAKYAAELEGDEPEVKPTTDKEMEERQSQFMKHVSEIPPALGRGMLRSVQEMGNFVIDAADWAEDNLAEAGYGDGKFITEESQLTFGDRSFDAPETMTGNIVQGIGQFVLPFAAFNKAIKVGQGAVGAAKLARAAGIGAAVDFTAFDPNEERLSNFLNTFPSLKTPVSEYLAANPKDTKAEGRLKNAIEGLGLGVATDFVFAGLSKGLNFYKARRMANNVKVEADEVVKQVGDVKYDELPDIEVPEREAVEQVDEGVDLPPTPDEDSMSLKIAQKVEEIKGRTSGEAKLGDLEEFPFEEFYEPVEYVVPDRNIDDLINKGSYLERRDYINELVELNPELKELGITPEPNITDIPDLANIRDIGDDTVIAMIQKGAPPELIQKMINLNHKEFKNILGEAGIDPEFKLTGRDERVLAALVEYASEVDSAKGAVDLLGEAESAKGSPTKAFHGTPHEFRDFSTEAINTGEGTQWEGWGLYFSSSEGTANWYRKMLSGSDKKGHTYRVELPARNELIHRDKKFSEQPKAIQEKLLALRENIKNTVGQGDFKSQPRALEILDAMEEGPMRLFVQNLEELFGSDKAVSQYLNNNGIKGFEYFGESAANFVIFDDKSIQTILRTSPDMIPPELPPESMTKQAINKKANQIRQRLKEKRWTQQEPPPIPKFEDVVVGEGERAVNINLDKITSTDDVAKVLKSMAKQYAGEIDEARRGVVTDAERETLAENLGMSMKDVMELQRGQALNAEELRAANNLLSVSASTVFDLAKKVKEGDDSTGMKALLLQAFDTHRIVQSKVSGAIAEAGRALRAMKADVDLDKAAKNRYLKELIDQNGGDKGVMDLVEALDQMGGSTKDVTVLARKSMNRGLQKALKEALVNSWLSGIKTQAINVASNSFTFLTRPVERGAAAMLSKGGPDSVAKGEVMAMIQGMLGGYQDAFAMAGKAFKTGESAFRGSQKFIIEKTPVAGAKNYENAISSATFNLDSTSLFGRMLDFMGHAINIPTRGLESADEFFKAINYRAELYAQAYRKAYRNKLDLNLSEAEFQAQLKEFLANPDESIQMKSLEAARESTFTKPLDPTLSNVPPF
jgi:hypothetical protein